MERVFGVVSTGKHGSVAAKSMTLPSKGKDLDTVSLKSEKSAVGREEFRNLAKHADSQSITSTDSEDFLRNSEHTKSELANSKVKGKYGSIWKTPQTHRRARSTDFSSVLKEWSDRTSPPAEEPKMSVFDPKRTERVNRSDQKSTIPDLSQDCSLPISDLPSILKSLQNTQPGQNLYHNLEPKNFTQNLEKSNERMKENYEITSTSIPWTKKKKSHHAFRLEELKLSRVIFFC